MAELHQDERRLLVLIEMTEGLRVTGSPLTPRVITIAGGRLTRRSPASTFAAWGS